MEETTTFRSGNVIYTINNTERIVTATIVCQFDDPETIFDNKLEKLIDGHGQGPIVSYEYNNQRYAILEEYTGKAKCHPDDAFDVEFGKRLALLRAQRKYRKAVYDALCRMEAWVDMFHKELEGITFRHHRILIENGCEIYKIEQQAGLYEKHNEESERHE